MSRRASTSSWERSADGPAQACPRGLDRVCAGVDRQHWSPGLRVRLYLEDDRYRAAQRDGGEALDRPDRLRHHRRRDGWAAGARARVFGQSLAGLKVAVLMVSGARGLFRAAHRLLQQPDQRRARLDRRRGRDLLAQYSRPFRLDATTAERGAGAAGDVPPDAGDGRPFTAAGLHLGLLAQPLGAQFPRSLHAEGHPAAGDGGAADGPLRAPLRPDGDRPEQCDGPRSLDATTPGWRPAAALDVPVEQRLWPPAFRDRDPAPPRRHAGHRRLHLCGALRPAGGAAGRGATGFDLHDPVRDKALRTVVAAPLPAPCLHAVWTGAVAALRQPLCRPGWGAPA